MNSAFTQRQNSTENSQRITTASWNQPFLLPASLQSQIKVTKRKKRGRKRPLGLATGLSWQWKTTDLSSLSKCFCCQLHLSFPPPSGRLFSFFFKDSSLNNTVQHCCQRWATNSARLLTGQPKTRTNNHKLPCTPADALCFGGFVNKRGLWLWSQAYIQWLPCGILLIFISGFLHILHFNFVLFSQDFLYAFEGLTGFHSS